MDSVWFSRNQLVHHGGNLNIIHLLWTICSRYHELICVWLEKVSNLHPVWHPPPLDSWKFNFDVAIWKSLAFTTIVYRDYEGNILFVRTKRLLLLVGEARASLFAAQEVFLILDVPIILEGDSLLVMDSINQRGRGDAWQISALVSDIHRLAHGRDNWKFEHVKTTKIKVFSGGFGNHW
ncbi:hypothetical protein CJ030_MR0G003935 [Morella rubra]|uniref:RNase H type-1 domain-containing protein n=1 Tax=Morella rubra TaxID=262757 RepID=A0A6A1UMF6_9ROSI|nr:hypothetical protein CJ030_MR0G003935 [Morella rubra]